MIFPKGGHATAARQREKKSILTGGMILITLGVLIGSTRNAVTGGAPKGPPAVAIAILMIPQNRGEKGSLHGDPAE